MGRLFVLSLEGKIYSCKHCRTHLALCEDIVSKFAKYLMLVSVKKRGDKLYKPYPLFSTENGQLAYEIAVKTGSFQCRHGKAYLFSKVVNITSGETEERMMMTGMHTVADIFCVGCGSIVGWKYETAHEKSQKYKEGKSVLERVKISGPEGNNYWVSHGAHVGGSDADDA